MRIWLVDVFDCGTAASGASVHEPRGTNRAAMTWRIAVKVLKRHMYERLQPRRLVVRAAEKLGPLGCVALAVGVYPTRKRRVGVDRPFDRMPIPWSMRPSVPRD